MIALTLSDGVIENEEVFINPMNIIGIIANEEGSTDIICVDQTVFEVKETPIQVFNLINNRVN